MEQPHNRRVCVRGIILKEGKLFCQELKNKDGTGRGFWCTPGGGLDPRESLVDGLRREIIEETGIVPDIGNLLFIQQFTDPDRTSHEQHEQLEFFFHIKNVDDFEAIDETASHFEAEILNYGFVNPATDNILPKFLRNIDIKHYTETDCQPYIYVELAD